MNEWKQLITAGNRNYPADLDLSERGYQKAKARASHLLQHWFNEDEALAALVVSYLNLADLYCFKDQPAKAEKEIQTLYGYLTQHFMQTSSQVRKAAIYRSLKQTYSAYLIHAQSYDVFDDPLSCPTNWLENERDVSCTTTQTTQHNGASK